MAYHGGAVTGHRTSPKAVLQKQVIAAALNLRARGKKLDEIADLLGLANRSHAYALIDKGLTYAIREPAERVKELELSRLDALTDAFWDSAMGVPERTLDAPLMMPDGRIIPPGTVIAAKGPDEKAAAVLLKAMERRARLEGLDAPKATKMDVSVTRTETPKGPSEQELLDYNVKLIAALNIAGALRLELPEGAKELDNQRRVLDADYVEGPRGPVKLVYSDQEEVPDDQG